MTIGAWICFVIFSVLIACVCLLVMDMCISVPGRVLCGAAAVAIIVAMFLCFRWYFTKTASGQRALVDQKSNISNGIERTVTVYTADGETIAQYKGKIDIDANDGGYVKFDFDGKRYIYYNCFVESIADIN